MPQTVSTVQEYVERLPEDRQQSFTSVRQLIRKHWPKSREDMAFGHPTYHLGGQPLFAVASQKNHLTFHVLPPGMLSVFNQDLRARDRGKSCVRFRKLEEADLELIRKIVLYVGTTFAVVAPGRNTRERV